MEEMKTIKLEIELSDAMDYLAFLQAQIEMMRKYSDTPDAIIMTSKIEKLQMNINNAIVDQVGIEEIQRVITDRQ